MLSRYIKSRARRLVFRRRQNGLGFGSSEAGSGWDLLSVLILCHNQLEYTQKCLESLFKFTTKFEVLVLDNASTDGTWNWLQEYRKTHTNVRVWHSDKNLGYVGGNNLLVQKAKGDYICIVNNDVEFRGAWIEQMIAVFDRDKSVAQVGPVGVYGFLGPQGVGNKRFGHTGEQEYIEGWLFVIPRWVYDKFGLFDDKNLKFCYGEDSDFSLRLREAGYRIKTIKILVHHYGGMTSKSIGEGSFELRKAFQENHQYLQRRWAGYLKNRKFVRNALFIRAGGIGDVLLTTPVLREFKKQFPDCRITFATMVWDVLEGNKYIDEVVDVRGIKSYDKDYKLEFFYERTPQQHIVKSYMDQAGVMSNNWTLDFELSEGDVQFAQRKLGNDRWVVVHTGRSWPSREWGYDKWEELVLELKKLGVKIAEVGRADTYVLQGIDLRLCGQTTIKQLGAIIQQGVLFIGIDSCPAHIALAVGTKSVVLYGSINPLYRVIDSKLQRSIQAEMECIGCHHQSDTPHVYSQCRYGTNECMQRIKTEQVLEACVSQLGL